MSNLDFINALAIEYGMTTEHVQQLCEQFGVDIREVIDHPFNEQTVNGLQPSDQVAVN